MDSLTRIANMIGEIEEEAAALPYTHPTYLSTRPHLARRRALHLTRGLLINLALRMTPQYDYTLQMWTRWTWEEGLVYVGHGNEPDTPRILTPEVLDLIGVEIPAPETIDLTQWLIDNEGGEVDGDLHQTDGGNE